MRLPKDYDNRTVPVAKFGEVINLDGKDAADYTEAFEKDSIVQITAESDCRVAIGFEIEADDENSVMLTFGSFREYFVPEGERISVIGGKLNILNIGE